jgi:ATP-dependent Lon protease
MPGGKGFQLTGSLGDVMQESARAALSYVRSNSKKLGVPDGFFNEQDLHLHIPAGAQPKDGPSAGVTMVSTLVSLATGRMIKANVGMTGEITLRGQVMPVGGIKEKVLAAHRAGLKTVILPKRNESDLEDLSEEVLNEIEFHFVEMMDEVLDLVLEKPKKTAPAKKTKAKKKTSPAKKTSPKTKTSPAKKTGSTKTKKKE